MTGQSRKHGANKVEVSGFVGWVLSSAAFFFFLFWAYLPPDVLKSAGLTYVPAQYWALAVPAQLVSTAVFVVVFYVSLNMKNTPPLNKSCLVSDHLGRSITSDDFMAQMSFKTNEDTIPPPGDIPLTQVCETLYGSGTVGGE